MVLAFIEEEGGTPNPVCLQMLTAAREVASALDVPLEAVVLGGADGAPGELRGRSIARIHRIEHPAFVERVPDAWAASLAQLVAATRPRVVMAGGTESGHDLMARLAARTGLPLACNCVAVVAGGTIRVRRQRWGSSLLEDAEIRGNPSLITIAAHVLSAAPASLPAEAVDTEIFTPVVDGKDLRVRVRVREAWQAQGVDLKTASVVVGGGRGVGSREGFRILEELAGLLGGATGGSRVATNFGWRPHSDQIGLTGNRIAPDLYIACGISGAIQHLVGCKGAKHVMVINRDPEAPFFQRADYGVVGDLHDIVPALIEALRQRRAGHGGASPGGASRGAATSR